MNNYIPVEEFLKQSKKVQKSFLDWWKSQIQMYDLFFRNFENDSNNYLKGIFKSCIQDNETLKNAIKDDTFMPLLQTHQLIKFIEDDVKELDIKHTDDGILLYSNYKILSDLDNLQQNLLQSLWQVACKIAKQED